MKKKIYEWKLRDDFWKWIQFYINHPHPSGQPSEERKHKQQCWKNDYVFFEKFRPPKKIFFSPKIFFSKDKILKKVEGWL